jgi:signal transduction histidine kinase
MAIRDDGIGFDPAKEYKNPAGLGLRTLKQRVRWLGGEFKLESGPGKGTSLEVQIPLEEPNEKG